MPSTNLSRDNKVPPASHSDDTVIFAFVANSTADGERETRYHNKFQTPAMSHTYLLGALNLMHQNNAGNVETVMQPTYPYQKDQVKIN